MKRFGKIVYCFLVITRTVWAVSDGSLDKAFYAAGTVIADYSSTAKAMAIQADGKVVVAGYCAIDDHNRFAVARFNDDGSLDETFGNGGLVTTSFGAGEKISGAQAIVIQPDGKILAAGFTNAIRNTFRWCLARYHGDGSLDESFFGDRGIIPGTVITAFYKDEKASQINGLALQPDGKIIAAGFVALVDSVRVGIARYNQDGSLDKNFNQCGDDSMPGTLCMNLDKGSPDDRANAVALQPDGKIVVAGSSYALGYKTFALARYMPDGKLDNAFYDVAHSRVHGVILTVFGAGERESAANALVIQPDGKIVVGGYTDSNNCAKKSRFALARYTQRGLLDASFGAHELVTIPGTVVTGFGPHETAGHINALVLQADGKIVAGGSTKIDDKSIFAVARYNENGILDEGTARTSFTNSAHDEIFGMGIHADGTITAVGRTLANIRPAFAVARYTCCNGQLSRPLITCPEDSRRFIDGSAISLKGTAQPHACVHLLVDGAFVGGTIADRLNGHWQFTLPPLTSGYHQLMAVEAYKNGNVNLQSCPITVHIDQHPAPRNCVWETVGFNTIQNLLGAQGASGNYRFKIIASEGGYAHLNDDNSCSFTPSIPFGKGKIIFKVTDEVTNCSTIGNVEIAIHRRPESDGAQFETGYATTLTADLKNSTIIGQPPFEFNLIGVEGGTMDLAHDGSFMFKPADQFAGSAHIQYTITDAHKGVSDPVTATITVHRAPCCIQEKLWTLKGKPLTGSLVPLVTQDRGPYRFELAGAVENGGIKINHDGSYLFIAAANFIGTVKVPLSIIDSQQTKMTGMLEIIVKEEPKVSDSSFAVGQGDVFVGTLRDTLSGGAAPCTFELDQTNKNALILMNEDGTFICTPQPDFLGEFCFTYCVKDAHGTKSNCATCSINVNEKPQPSIIKREIQQGEKFSGSLHALVRGGTPPYTFKKLADPQNGSLIINPDGVYELVPDENFVGSIGFKYLVTDAKGTKNVDGSVSVTVHEKPRLGYCHREVSQGNALIDSLTPLVMGGYPPYTFQKVGESKGGTVTVDPCGTYQFIPDEDFFGDAEFCYVATDVKKSFSKIGTVSITVHEQPRVNNVAHQLCQGHEIAGCLQDLVEGGTPPYIFEKVNDARKNSVTVDKDGSYYYKPCADFVGRVKCNFVAIDAKGSKSKWGALLITVNEKPRVRNTKLTISQGEQLSGSLKGLIQGGQPPYSFQKVGDTHGGSLILNPDGSYCFTPHEGFIGTTECAYKVIDARTTQSTNADIFITVNEKPQAHPVEHEIIQGNALIGSLTPFVLGGNPPYIFQKAEDPQDGSLIMSPCGFYQFIPDAHFAGKTKFNYSITDCAQSITKNAQVIVTVHGIPRVNNLILNVAQGKRIAGSLQELVSGGCPPYTFVKVYESKECGLTIHEDGSYECVADCDFAGTAECGYMVVDAHSLQSAPATITLQIEGNPRIKDIHLEVAQAHELAGSLAPLVTGGNPPYSWIKLGQNKDGVFTLNADGTFSFKPNPDFFGTTSCRYMAIDAKGHKTVPGKIVITVNEEPRLAKLSQEIAQGQALIGSLTPLVIAGFPPYVFQKIEEPADGNLMLNECGTYQFVPRRDFAGKTTFNYTVTDIKNSVSKPSLVTVTVHDKPRIANKRVEMIKGEEIFGSLAALVEGGHKPYTFQKVGEPENGSLQISSDGSFKFIPNPEFAGNAVCYYAVIDGKKAQSAPGTLEITVHEKLHVSPERVTVAQGETLAGSLKKLLPVNEQLFTFQKVAGPHSGSLIINADGSYQFIPEQDFVGTTEFSYSAVDAKKITGIEGSVIITVLEKPQILNADKEICQGNLLRGALTQCVAGGYPPYTFKKVSESPDGTVMIDPCGTYQFVPAEQFAGTTEFAYAVTDMKNSVSKTGHVSVTVNERPRVGNTAFEICQGQELSGSLCALVTGGTPPYRFQKVAGSRENPLVIHPDGSYECHPDAHFVGRIKGSYVAIDAKGSRSTQGSILLTVNEQPRAGTIQLTTAQGEQLTGSLQGLVQGGQPPYRFQKIDESECGSLIINPDGSYQFNPHNDFFGTVALKYCAVDARKVKSCEGTMVVTVYQKPCAISEEREISEGQMLVGSLTPSVMGGYPPYSFKKMGEPQDGTLFINSCGAYQFMPAQNFAGKTVFNYSVTDIKQSLSNTGEVHITVHGRPVAKNAAFEINQGEQITGSLQDLVIGGNPPYTFVKEGDSKENNFVVERDGSYRCFPSGDFAGKIECNYRVVDAKQALSMPATITLVVHEKPHVKNADQTLSQGDTCVGSLRELVSGGTAPYIFEKVEDPGTGTFVLNSDGSYTFTPRQDFVGTTVFKYVAIDARKLLSNQAAIVMVVNEKPITRDSVAEISQGQMLVGSLTPSVMGGFPPYTFHKMGEPKEGTLFINSCGTYQFMPAADFAGTTAFNFSVTDIKKSVSKTSQVQVKVHQRPQVNDTKFTVPKGSEVIGSLLEVTTAGTPPYTFEKVGNSVNGNKIALSGDGIYHFGPDAQFVGNTEINFVAIDANKARSLPGKLIISVDLK